MVRFNEQVDAVRFSFGFGLTVPIRGRWRVELSWRQLRKNSANRSCTSSSCPSASAWTDATKDASSTPAPPVSEADDTTPRDYNLPIPSLKVVPDDYERDKDNDRKDEKVEGGEIFVVEAV